MLSKRETAVAKLYATGKSYKEIARRFSVSPATVRNQIASVFRKLDVHDKAQLACQLAGLGERENRKNQLIQTEGDKSRLKGNDCSSYTCSEYPGFNYCPGKVQARTESELWELIKIHAVVEHGESPADWTADEVRKIKSLIKPCD